MDGKNKLVNLSDAQKDPNKAKPSDFPKTGGPAGMAEGQNEHLVQSYNQEGPRHSEDGSHLRPSEWGKGGTEFKVGRASEGSTPVHTSESVNLETGKCTGSY